MTTLATTPPLIRSLQNPALYPHEADDILLIETHISWVILAGNYVYKIKKPLDLGFLDFSTAKKRQHYCLEELRLNRRLAPDIYLDVVTINGSESRPNLDGRGAVIDYAVKMRRFDHQRTFDHLLQRELLTAEHIRQTARIIAEFHDRITPAADASRYGLPDTVMQPVRENFMQIERLQEIEHPELLSSLKQWSERAFIALQPALLQRKRDGFIRECHGDLHLGNIVLIDETPVPFDGIEFNPALYWIDVISEVAFLVMDLADNRRIDLAFRFLNDYLQHTGDYAALELFRFYLVYRAMVRAKVGAIRACQPIDNKQRQQAEESYRTYLRLANDFTQPPSPRLWLMHGISASGKSWLSEQMLERLPAVRIRSDVERKRLFPPVSQEPAGFGQGLYNPDATRQTYDRLLQLARTILAAGFDVIVDATFLHRQQRRPFLELAETTGVPIAIIQTIADQETLDQRLRQRARQLDNVSDADREVLRHQLQTLQPLSNRELNYTYRIDTSRAETLTQFWNYLDEFKH